MNKTLLIVLLVVAVLILAFLIAVMYPRFRASVANMRVGSFIALIVIMLAIVGVLLYFIFGPNGGGDKADGIAAGTEGEEKSVTELEEDMGEGAGFDLNKALSTNTPGDKSVHIVIRETVIRIGDTVFEDVDTVRKVLDTEEFRQAQYRLEDDYALSGVYKAVRAVLDELGVKYRETSTD